jgi:hypothetical protein
VQATGYGPVAVDVTKAAAKKLKVLKTRNEFTGAGRIYGN